MNRSFRRYIITYALLIVFCLCLVVPTYMLLYDQYRTQCFEESRLQLRSGLTAFSQDVNRLFLFMQSFRGNERNTRISNVRGDIKPVHLWWLEQARAEIQTGLALLGEGGAVAEFGILYPNGMCATSRRSYAQYGDMYRNFFHCDGMTAQQWAYRLRECADGKGMMGDTSYVSFDEGTFYGITIVRRVESQILFCVLYSENVLARLVPENLRGGAVVMLGTTEGRMLAQSSLMIDGPFEAVTYGNLATGLRAEVAIPDSLIQERVNGFRTPALASVGILVVAGGVLAILLAYKDSKPVRALVATMRELSAPVREEGGNEYEQIEHTLRSLDGEVLSMRQTMTEQEKLIEAGLVERFLHGLTHAPEEIAAAARYFEPQSGEYCVLMVRVVGAAESDVGAERNIAARLLLQHIDLNLRLHLSGMDRIVTVLPVGAGRFMTPEDYLTPLRATAAQMRTQYSIQGLFAVSDVFALLSSLPDACAQTRHILRLYTGGLGREVLYRSDLSAAEGVYMMDFVEMQRFYETLAAGAEEGAQGLVRSVFGNIRRQGFIGEAELARALLSFRQAFDRVRAELPALCLPPPPAHGNIESLDRAEAEILDYTAQACRKIQSLHSSEETDFAASILAYVNARLADPALYVASVADAFSLSERRLQALMRKASGKSFFDYVETCRMETAYRLLAETDMPVNDIAGVCGFALANSFYKAFKRRYGVPPSAVREKGQVAPAGAERREVPE